MAVYLESLRGHRAELDAINVYPVADADTGTNLLHTQAAVQRALESLPNDADRRTTVETAVDASLRGARGNSGVLLSQMLRGIGAGDETDLAAALEAGASAVAAAFARPVEGTAVTVTRDAAAAARARATGGGDPIQVLEAALAAAETSLARTTEILPELRAAGVVDAGAKGIVLLLRAVASSLADDPMPIEAGTPIPVSSAEPGANVVRYEVQYLLEAADGAAATLRKAIDALGDSVAVVEHAGVVRVHAHTDRPDAVIAAGARVATPQEVSVAPLDRGGAT
jgi:dihydroxyacetone kinase-like predicted kinase